MTNGPAQKREWGTWQDSSGKWHWVANNVRDETRIETACGRTLQKPGGAVLFFNMELGDIRQRCEDCIMQRGGWKRHEKDTLGNPRQEIHLHLEVHPGNTNEQIDYIFASMARHFYGTQDETQDRPQ